MSHWAYYNEHNPKAAAWLRELITLGMIAPGEVDERDIKEVTPDDVREFTQVHLFAGIGGWSRALRLAGWNDARHVWTGSPPCQPFSVAGPQRGVSDDRHLAPHFIELVRAVRPPVVFGEQVAGAVRKDDWIDDLLDELEAEGYTTGAAVLASCSVGSPNIRQRLYFTGRLDHPGEPGLEGLTWNEPRVDKPGRVETNALRPTTPASDRTLGVADAEHDGSSDTEKRGDTATSSDRGTQGEIPAVEPAGDGGSGRYRCVPTGKWQTRMQGPSAHHFYGRADWMLCRDWKWRPLEPGIGPLVAGVPGRMVPSSYQGMAINPDKSLEARQMRLEGYGNAINPYLAAEVVKAIM